MRNRKNIRLQGYDYSKNGYYFITICVKNKHQLLSQIVWTSVGAATCRPHIKLTNEGKITDSAIKNIPKIYPMISVDKYVIMPNHIHMILVWHDNGRQIAAPTIQNVIGHLKRTISIQCTFSSWQKSFHDHIIRNENEYQHICQYIDENPQNGQKMIII